MQCGRQQGEGCVREGGGWGREGSCGLAGLSGCWHLRLLSSQGDCREGSSRLGLESFVPAPSQHPVASEQSRALHSPLPPAWIQELTTMAPEPPALVLICEKEVGDWPGVIIHRRVGPSGDKLLGTRCPARVLT